jgi:glycosyltransferase involved in cell wall biosynthesis
VAGSGPLEELARSAFGDRYLGHQLPERVRALLRGALYLVAPSVSYETFGLALIEAFSCGTPVIASRHGAFAELVKEGETGLLFTPGDAHALADRIAWADSHPEEMLAMGRAARREYERHYTPRRNIDMLIDIYNDAISCSSEDRHAA